MEEFLSLLFGDEPAGIAPRFHGIVFDFDGTLADSMQVWYWVDEEFLRRRHLAEPENYGTVLSTLGFRESAEWVVETFHLDESIEDVMDEWNELALEYYSTNVYLKPHAEEFVRLVRSKGLKTSIATTLTPELLFATLKVNGVRDLFDAVAFGGECAHDKHEPDVYLLASDRMEVPPDRCVVFEDILPGIRSAKKAGMYAVGVRDESGHQDTEAIRAEADLFIDGFKDLVG